MYTAGRLQSWLKREPDADRRLRMQRELLLARDPGALEQQFPDHLQCEDMRYRLSYRFEPGGLTDGVSVTVPVALLNRVPRHRFEWLVPGLLREKCIQLVKGLPKEKRKRLVPAPDFVDRALANLEPGNVSLLDSLARELSRLGGLRLETSDLSTAKLDDYYRMNVRVVDARGKLLEQGRDLGALIERFRDDTRQSVSSDRESSPARSGIQRWDFDALPREWRFRQAGVDIHSWPALVDKGATVSVELFDYPAEARLNHRLGVLRLLRLHSAQQVKYLRKQVLRGNEFNLVLAGTGLERSALIDDLIDAAFVQAMALDENLPYEQAAFSQMLERGKGELIGAASELEGVLLNGLRALTEARQKLAALDADRYQDTRADVESQLAGLLAPSFLRDTPQAWLAQYPRYMKALRTRVERLTGQYSKDQNNTGLLQALIEPLQEALSARPGLLLQYEGAREYRWMLEEFRVSLFAQSLGTRLPVSRKRLQEQWQQVERWLADNPY
jgi:ATP-dependent helicase HrpA